MRELRFSSVQHILMLILVLAAASTACQSAATAASGQAIDDFTSISITVLDPVALQFGAILPKGGGTVTVTADGMCTTTGVQVIENSPCTPAHLLVGGNRNNAFNITLPQSATIASGEHVMLIDSFTSNPSGAGSLNNLNLHHEFPVTSCADLFIGATLHVEAKQPLGNYSGSFTISVAYD